MLTRPGAVGVPTDAAGALLIHSATKRNACLECPSGIRCELLPTTTRRLSDTHAGSVIDAGGALPVAPYTCAVMPSVEPVSVSADSFCAVFRSITSPSAIFGATAGSTTAVQAVDFSLSIARLGSPKLPAGWAYGL